MEEDKLPVEVKKREDASSRRRFVLQIVQPAVAPGG